MSKGIVKNSLHNGIVKNVIQQKTIQFTIGQSQCPEPRVSK